MNRIRKNILTAVCLLLCPMMVTAGPVNINTADAATLAAELQGVGISKANAIVEYRKVNGPFGSATDLTAVKGIGTRTVEINRDNILLRAPKDKSK